MYKYVLLLHSMYSYSSTLKRKILDQNFLSLHCIHFFYLSISKNSIDWIKVWNLHLHQIFSISVLVLNLSLTFIKETNIFEQNIWTYKDWEKYLKYFSFPRTYSSAIQPLQRLGKIFSRVQNISQEISRTQPKNSPKNLA